MTYDIIVLGSGPAGLAAAVGARGRGKRVLVIGNRWQDSPLAHRQTVSPRDLWDKPLILSRQVDNKSGLYRWLRKEPSELRTVATYNLIYNASLMVDEGMGYAFTLDKLVNTDGSNLCFRPLAPRLELGMYLVWKRSQIFSKAAELFLAELRTQLPEESEDEKGEDTDGSLHS